MKTRRNGIRAIILLLLCMLCCTLLCARAEGYTLLVKGDKGAKVKQLQSRLSELGYLDGEADGVYGNDTRDAVILFQRTAGLKADGKAGNATQSRLYAADAPYAERTDTLAGEQPLLINKEFTAGDHFVPADLVLLSDVIPEGLCTYKNKGIKGVREAAEAWAELLQAAHADGLVKWQFSEGWRSYDRQKELFDASVNRFINNNGMSRSRAISATRLTVADPGTSEHHTGLAFDMTVPGKNFCDTAQYRWMKQHCWEYGFILRYTDEKQSITGFLGEEWHYRYVGKEHAMRIHELGICLEEYIDMLNSER